MENENEGKRAMREKEMKTTIDMIGDDLLEIILSQLPALSFAFAACVSHSWNSICLRVLSIPKLFSVVSLQPSLPGAMKEVVDKVLSGPIRPHFAILCIAPSFDLQLAHDYIIEALGTRTAVVSHKSRGIMGKNALTNEFIEIQWKREQNCQSDQLLHGVSLTVGFLPGVKVDAIPLLLPRGKLWPQPHHVSGSGSISETFACNIRQYSRAFSSCKSPAGIILFGGSEVDMKPVLDMMDDKLHTETFVVGDECCDFLYRAVLDSHNTYDPCAGVALLFVKDRNKPRGIGDIQFHVSMSAGMTPIGPTYRAASVISKGSSTWLYGTNGDSHEYINAKSMIQDIDEELGNEIYPGGLYIGVTKRRQHNHGLFTSLAFHDVTKGDEAYLYVEGCGIKTGDYFRFYYPDSKKALPTYSSVSKGLKKLKQDFDASADKTQVFGGLIFTCDGYGDGCGESIYGDAYVDSAPFLENFPGVPMGGTFCEGLILRGSANMFCQETEEHSSVVSCLHAYSSVYLVMSYTPPQPENQE